MDKGGLVLLASTNIGFGKCQLTLSDLARRECFPYLEL